MREPDQGVRPSDGGGDAKEVIAVVQPMRFSDYDTLFQTALKAAGAIPHDFQRRFAQEPKPFDVIRAPTGSGKTEAVLLGWVYRRFGADDAVRLATPRRLVYCLPMRTLVEQTRDRAVRYLHNLDLLAGRAVFDPTDPKKLTGYTPPAPIEPTSEAVAVHLLLGGSADDDWTLNPERNAILIGTQDMLLSRALNRGYARSRFQWPVDFGLLNNDCLWVYDELQLMGSGVSTSAQLAGLRDAMTFEEYAALRSVSTSAQLAGLRDRLMTFGPTRSVWMSATMDRTWLRTVDLRDRVHSLAELTLTESELTTGDLGRRMTAIKTLQAAGIVSTDKDGPKKVAELVKAKHEAGTLTLVVLNTVNRAKEVFSLVEKTLKTVDSKPELLLIHSRFRPTERKILNDALQDKALPPGGRIIVATQVVEAGVDISARVLITDLAPWSSLVQRFGRCHRIGEPEWDGEIYWLDVDVDKGLPYQKDELDKAKQYLAALEGQDVSPKSLEDFRFEGDRVELKFEHIHVVRRRDLLDLFDTAPDLSGNDIDVSRFVRGDDKDLDVQVFWRVGPPDKSWDKTEQRRQAPRRDELCNVPVGSFRKEFLEAGKTAYRWSPLDGVWQEIGRKDAGSLIPGQVFWVQVDQGGYDLKSGWTPTAGSLPPTFPLPMPPKPADDEGETDFDSDDWSRVGWRTIVGHTDEVAVELQEIVRSLGLSGDPETALHLAARWHDWGKIHPIFQDAIMQEGIRPGAIRRAREGGGPEPLPEPRPEEWAATPDLAKAPDGFWRRRYRRELPPPAPGVEARRIPARRFRHELASALGVLTELTDGRALPGWVGVSPLVRNLAVYLIAAHHGKVRLSIRTMPDEEPPADAKRLFACGLWQGDRLPAVSLSKDIQTPEVQLDLSPMLLGGDGSWSARALSLLHELGPFRMAYLEATLRAADVLASKKADQSTEDNDV